MSDKEQLPPTAGMVVIGNEILTGKTQDINSGFLSRELNIIGVDLCRITTIPDDFEEIGQTVKEFAEEFDWVFTSGGIGPTHDDITIPAISAAWGVEAHRHPLMEKLIRKYYQDKVTEDHLLMALVPDGGELVEFPMPALPQLKFHNIFIMPGVPQLFQHRVKGVKNMLGGIPVSIKEVFLKADEGHIARALRDVDDAHPEVLIGSYPDFFHSDYSVKVTLESRNPAELGAAWAALEKLFSAEKVHIVRVS